MCVLWLSSMSVQRLFYSGLIVVLHDLFDYLNLMAAGGQIRFWKNILSHLFFTSSTLPPLSWSCVSTQRKPEEEQSPVKETDAKQAKQEATLNGSGDSTARNGNGVQEGESQEASDRVYSTWSCPEGVTFVSFFWSALGRSWNESRGPLIKHDSLLMVVVWFLHCI